MLHLQSFGNLPGSQSHSSSQQEMATTEAVFALIQKKQGIHNQGQNLMEEELEEQRQGENSMCKRRVQGQSPKLSQKSTNNSVISANNV